NRGRGRGSRVGRGAPPGHTPGRIYVLTFFAAFLTFLPLCLTSALPWSALPSASSRFLPVTFPAASFTFPLAFSPVCLAFLSVAIAGPLFGWSESAQRRFHGVPHFAQTQPQRLHPPTWHQDRSDSLRRASTSTSDQARGRGMP